MRRVDAYAAAYIFQTSRTGRVLTAGHTRCKVVRDDDHDIGARIDAVKQTRYTRVSEGRVADDGYRRPLSGIGGTLGHSYRRTHFDAGMYRMERRQSAERIASYIAEYAGILILSRHLVQRRVHIAMTAAHAQGGRTRHDQIVGLTARQRLHTQSLAHRVGCKLAHARQLARQASLYGHGRRNQTAHHLLDDRLSLLHDHDLLGAVGDHLPDERLGQRILRDLQDAALTTLGAVLFEIVICYTACDDSARRLLAAAV